MKSYLLLLPFATYWVKRQRDKIRKYGRPLSLAESEIARKLGIGCPENVRILSVSEVPMPVNKLLRAVAFKAGLLSVLGPGAMTMDNGIYVCRQFDGDLGLVAHELAHVAQYERLGGVGPFLKEYISQCIQIGYDNAPLEVEARAVSSRYCQ